MNLNERIKVLMDENVKQRSVLKEKTYELEALTYKYRKIQSMVQSGQYLQVLNTTTAASSFAQASSPSPDITKGQTANSVSLKSRSPTHGPVSFSLLKDTTDQSNLVGSIKGRNGSCQETLDDGSNLKYGLRKSPLMSSTTQITTTNTTSSTNNTTDLTNDYSSSKCILTSSTNGNVSATNQASSNEQRQLTGKRAFVAFDCVADRLEKDENNVAPFQLPSSAVSNSRQPVYSQNLICGSRNQQQLPLISGGSAQSMKSRVLVGLHSQNNSNNNGGAIKQSPKFATDSSYCSVGAEFETSGSVGHQIRGGDVSYLGKTQDDIDLFTVFHNIAATKPIRKRQQQFGRESTEDTFTRWSEGPFCTLMVRNNEQHSRQSKFGALKMGPGRVVQRSAMKKPLIKEQQAPRKHQQLDDGDVRASCPDISNKTPQTSSIAEQPHQIIAREASRLKPRKQLSQQIDQNLTKKSTSRSLNLHRTLSMIEYLGLDEFEMIAKRHDKLLNQKRSTISRRQVASSATCCYEIDECNCCDINSDKRVYCAKTRSLNQSDADIFSSNDLVNDSADLQQTSSRFSCSTCCSLASQTYQSQSELLDDISSESMTSPTASSSSATESSEQQSYMLNNQSQSTRSSSVIFGQLDADNEPATHHCQHHSQPSKTASSSEHQVQSMHHHHECHQSQHLQHHRGQQHRHHHSHHQLSGQNSSVSSSSSLCHQTIHKQTKGMNKGSTQHDLPLSTSGHLFCAPSSREDTTEAAAIHNLKSSEEKVKGSNQNLKEMMRTSQEENKEVLQEEDEDTESFLIKCDVLESL